MTEKVKKVTKSQRNIDIMAMLKGEVPPYNSTIVEAIAHLEHENQLLAKKNSGERKPSAKDLENETYKNLIMDIMIPKTPLTVTEIMRKVPEFTDLSNQKVASLVKSLMNDGKLIKTIEKGRSYFSIIE